MKRTQWLVGSAIWVILLVSLMGLASLLDGYTLEYNGQVEVTPLDPNDDYGAVGTSTPMVICYEPCSLNFVWDGETVKLWGVPYMPTYPTATQGPPILTPTPIRTAVPATRTPSPSPTPSAIGEYCRWTVGPQNIRSGPSTSFPAVDTIAAGACTLVYEEKVVSSTEIWFRVGTSRWLVYLYGAGVYYGSFDDYRP